MKTLLTILLLCAFTVSAQDNYSPAIIKAITLDYKKDGSIAMPFQSSDSVKINVSIQARDLEYMASVMPFSPQFEDLYDAIKKKFRIASPPLNNTSVAVDSIYVSTWFYLLERLRADHVAVAGGVLSRIETIIRAKNNVWLNAELDASAASITAIYVQKRAEGRKKLTRK